MRGICVKFAEINIKHKKNNQNEKIIAIDGGSPWRAGQPCGGQSGPH
jgi:hypothetical protein